MLRALSIELDDKNHDDNEAPLFATGRAIRHAFADAALIETLYTQDLPHLLRLLLHHNWQSQGNLGRSNVHLIDLPAELAEHTYADVFDYLLEHHDMVTLGLRRAPPANSTLLKEPYIVNSPAPSTIVHVSLLDPFLTHEH